MSNLNLGTEQFGDFSKSIVDSAMKFAKVSFDSAERMIALNLEAAKVSLDVTAKNANAATSVKDVQELNGLRTKAAETGLEFFVGYSKNLYDISTVAQAQYSSLVEERVSAFQKTVVEGIDKAAKNAPAGSDVAFAASDLLMPVPMPPTPPVMSAIFFVMIWSPICSASNNPPPIKKPRKCYFRG